MFRQLLGVTTMLAVAGCGGTSMPGPFDANARDVVVADGRDTARAFLYAGSCPVAARNAGPPPTAAPIFAGAALARAPVVADFSVRLLNDYLARVQAEHTATYRASGTGALRTDTGAILVSRCLIVVRGRFGEAVQETLPTARGVLTSFDLQALGLIAYPSLYMEASLSLDRTVPTTALPPKPAEASRRNRNARSSAAAPAAFADDMVILVRPEALQFAATAAPRRGDGRKAIGMVVVLRGAPLNKGATEEQAQQNAVAVLPFDFGIMQEGTAIAPRGTADIQLRHPFADQMRAIRVSAFGGTLNVEAFVTETGDTNRVLALLATTLKENSDTVEKAIADALKAGINSATTKSGQTGS